MKRYYVALTNQCNRACPFCSCYSDPNKKTYLDMETFEKVLPSEGNFELQLEGGEPTLHPQLLEMVKIARSTDRCLKIIMVTNGVLLPYCYDASSGELEQQETINSLCNFFDAFGAPLLLKVSINAYLLERDRRHLDKAELICAAFENLKSRGDYSLTFNVRRNKRPVSPDDDSWLVQELERRGLTPLCNIFFLQRYGKASSRTELDLPFIALEDLDFHLINPDGSDHSRDLVERSEAMGKLK